MLPAILLLTQCHPETKKEKNQEMKISETAINTVIHNLKNTHGEDMAFRIERGVQQTANLWRAADGSEEDFIAYCEQQFIADPVMLDKTFDKLSYYFEALFGNLNQLVLDLRKPSDLAGEALLPVDNVFKGYSPSSHLNNDLFGNKAAFLITLNFPTYTLNEKEEMSADWSRKQWAYARMGDMFTSRVPSAVRLKEGEVTSAADTYISDYNVYMGNLIDDQGASLFDKDLKLITHWGLRDELKSNYANALNGLQKQQMVYAVMKNIITQEIPQEVINKNDYQWNPFQNKLYKDGEEVKFTAEKNGRYQIFLNNFLAKKALDDYYPQNPKYIDRRFEESMEIAQEDVEALFTEFVSSPVVKEVAELIKKRLGRDLQPFDIWYDGFKSRSSINEAELDQLTRAKYPDPEALHADLDNILVKLQFSPDKAKEIAARIAVDPSRGAGHAWGAEMKTQKSHLRTRIAQNGMDYKGYNIAVHEFGHNVEQTLSLFDVDHYMMRGVPNTAFTEALAFIFQKRDLELLGINNDNPNKKHLLALDNFWSCYEIMGVSLVDMKVWKWMYANPDCTADQLKEAVVRISKEVWNEYYAPVFGMKDEPVLAIYSHMVESPLYLSAYPVGLLINFQIDRYMEGKNFAEEVTRIYTSGRLTPQLWMKKAVGKEISNEPITQAVKDALKVIQ